MQPLPLKNTHSSLSTIQATSSSTLVSAKKADISHFKESVSEEVSKNKLLTEAFAYFLQKVVMQNDNADVLKPFCDFILPTEAQLEDHSASSIHYLALINDNADSDETMAHIAELVLKQICSSYQGPVVLVGDGKTFEHLQHVKQLYGNALSKILLFPGDWHVLKNFQQVLMKGYYHTGLKDIAIKSGHRGETLKSLELCSHFKRTHHFLLQSWEAMFTEMVLSFLNANPQIDLKSSIQSIIDQNYSPPDHLLSIKEMLAEKSLFSEFRTYVTEQSKLDDTWRLWANFVLADCFCYVSLYVAIRMSSWDLRIGSLKSMASLFSAFDRPCYQKLLPQHISDIANYPSDVIECFRAGGFTVKITDGIGHAIALDEAHEMCVNRDMKMAVVRPTETYLKRTMHFFSYRIEAHKQLKLQLFPDNVEKIHHDSIFEKGAGIQRWEENIKSMRAIISEHKLFSNDCNTNRGLFNVFSGIKATPEQAHDLLNARELGEISYMNYISHHILQIPSIQNAPIR